jgi:hypothetical protein
MSSAIFPVDNDSSGRNGRSVRNHARDNHNVMANRDALKDKAGRRVRH